MIHQRLNLSRVNLSVDDRKRDTLNAKSNIFPAARRS